MKKQEFLKMMSEDIVTASNKAVLADVIDCMELALSQTSDSAEIESNKTAKEAFEFIEEYAKEKKSNCVGPWEAAEKVIAPYLGVKYTRLSTRLAVAPDALGVNLDDLL